MILVDTSIRIDHLRTPEATLVGLLERGLVLVHPFVAGEIALGSIRNRSGILQWLRRLPPARRADDHEILAMIERRGISATGIGYLDAHPVASALISDARLWTRDGKLAAMARRLGMAASPEDP